MLGLTPHAIRGTIAIGLNLGLPPFFSVAQLRGKSTVCQQPFRAISRYILLTPAVSANTGGGQTGLSSLQ